MNRYEGGREKRRHENMDCLVCDTPDVRDSVGGTYAYVCDNCNTMWGTQE